MSVQYLECIPPNDDNTIDTPIFMISIELRKSPIGNRTNVSLEVDITKSKPFFKGQTRKFQTSKFQWFGIQDSMMLFVDNILTNILDARVELDDKGDGVIGPLTSDELILFELSITNANLTFNQLALEYSERRGYNVANARQMYDDICKGA